MKTHLERAKEQYPIGTWVRFYRNNKSIISPVIGHRSRVGDTRVLTERGEVHPDYIIDSRPPLK